MRLTGNLNAHSGQNEARANAMVVLSHSGGREGWFTCNFDSIELFDPLLIKAVLYLATHTSNELPQSPENHDLESFLKSNILEARISSMSFTTEIWCQAGSWTWKDGGLS